MSNKKAADEVAFFIAFALAQITVAGPPLRFPAPTRQTRTDAPGAGAAGPRSVPGPPRRGRTRAGLGDP